jgi:hypothetical protein
MQLATPSGPKRALLPSPSLADASLYSLLFLQPANGLRVSLSCQTTEARLHTHGRPLFAAFGLARPSAQVYDRFPYVNFGCGICLSLLSYVHPKAFSFAFICVYGGPSCPPPSLNQGLGRRRECLKGRGDLLTCSAGPSHIVRVGYCALQPVF